MKITILNKQYKLREEAQLVYELLGLGVAIVASYGLFIAICKLIVLLPR